MEHNHSNEKPDLTADGIEEKLELFSDLLVIRAKSTGSVVMKIDPKAITETSITTPSQFNDGRFSIKFSGSNYFMSFKASNSGDFEKIKEKLA